MSNYSLPKKKTEQKRSLAELFKVAEQEESEIVKKGYLRGDNWNLADKFLIELRQEWNVKKGNVSERILLLAKLLKEEYKEIIGNLVREKIKEAQNKPGKVYIQEGDIRGDGIREAIENDPEVLGSKTIENIITAFEDEESRILNYTTISVDDVLSCSEYNRKIKEEEMESMLPFKEQAIAPLYNLSSNEYIPTKIINEPYIKDKINKFKEYLSQKVNVFSKKYWWTKELARYASSIATFELWNIASEFISQVDYALGFGYKTPCVIGGLPLRHIQSLEVARSGKILKFRADGSIFLAQQHGGEDAIKIEFKIYRTEIWYVLAIWALFLIGNGELKEIPSINANGVSITEIRKIMNVSQYDIQTKNPSYNYHRTFPIITRNIIIPNVYIETFSFEELVENGMDVIRCSLMLRTYREPDPEGMVTKLEGDNLFVGFKQTKKLKMFETIEFSMNAAWRLYRYMNPLLMTDNFISNRTMFNTDNDDVYYDIDLGDIAATVGLAVAGYKMFQ